MPQTLVSFISFPGLYVFAVCVSYVLCAHVRTLLGLWDGGMQGLMQGPWAGEYLS